MAARHDTRILRSRKVVVPILDDSAEESHPSKRVKGDEADESSHSADESEDSTENSDDRTSEGEKSSNPREKESEGKCFQLYESVCFLSVTCY